MTDIYIFIKKSLEYRKDQITRSVREQLTNHVENMPGPGHVRVGSLEVNVETPKSWKFVSKHKYELVIDGLFSVCITDSVDKDELYHSGGSFEVRVTCYRPLKRDYLEVDSVEVLSIRDPFDDVC